MNGVGERGWPGLAEAVTERRLALGLSVNAVAERVPTTRATWTSVEAGTARLQRQRWVAFERALGWEPGSIAAIVKGGEPIIAAAALGVAATSSELEHELDRIRALDVSPRLRRKLLTAMIEMFEAEQQESASNEYKSVS